MFLLSLCLNANVGKLRFPSFLFFRFLSPLARSAVHLYGDVRTIEDFPSGSLRPPVAAALHRASHFGIAANKKFYNCNKAFSSVFILSVRFNKTRKSL